jgi:hypothetical protein
MDEETVARAVIRARKIAFHADFRRKMAMPESTYRTLHRPGALDKLDLVKAGFWILKKPGSGNPITGQELHACAVTLL